MLYAFRSHVGVPLRDIRKLASQSYHLKIFTNYYTTAKLFPFSIFNSAKWEGDEFRRSFGMNSNIYFSVSTVIQAKLCICFLKITQYFCSNRKDICIQIKANHFSCSLKYSLCTVLLSINKNCQSIYKKKTKSINSLI